MTNREKFIEVFGDNPQRHHITKSWWDEEYVPSIIIKLSENEEDRPMTDHGLEIQLRGMCEKFLKENVKLDKKLREQTLMQEKIRTGVFSLIKKVGGTIYPCEYNDALVDVVRLIDKLEWEKNEEDE